MNWFASVEAQVLNLPRGDIERLTAGTSDYWAGLRPRVYDIDYHMKSPSDGLENPSIDDGNIIDRSHFP